MKGATLLAVDNRCEGYADAFLATEEASKGEALIVMWPLATTYAGRYLRNSSDTFYGWGFFRGAKWACQLISHTKPQLLVVPDRHWSIKRAIEWLSPSSLKLIRWDELVGNKLKGCCEELGVEVSDYVIGGVE